MTQKYKTKERPIEEISLLQKRIAELEAVDTELAEAEQTAKDAREYAENIVETIREPLIVLDADLKIISANKSFYQTFKVNPEETEGRFIYNLGDQQWDIPKLRHLLENILPEKFTFDNYEVEHDFPHIGRRIMLLNARRIPRPPAKPRIMLLAIEDITERRKAEQVVKDAREYAESIVDTVRESLIVLDTGLKVISANRSFYQTFKVNPEETEGRFIYDLGDRQWDIPKLRHLLEKILPENNPFDNYEIEHDFKTVGPKTMLLNARCLDGMILLAIEDITERKRAKDEARKSEGKFRSIFDNAGDGILLADLESGKFFIGNKTICRMLGYSQEEIKNLSIMDIHPKKDFPYIISQFERQTKREITLVTDIPVKRKNGSVFYADVNSSSVTIAGKTYLMGFFRDITERKQIDEKTRRMEEIKTTSEIKTKFTSMVSHELRSPLGAIKEGINLVLEGLVGNINDEQRDLLDIAKRNTDRLGRLINNVLDFQKIKSGKMEFDILENDINEVALEVNKSMSLLAKEKGLDLVVDVNDSIPRVRFDKDKIVEVLTNLVSNAIKYAEKGNITISTKQEDNTVHVIVQDAGRGIKAKDMQKLFQAFEQLDSTRDKKKGGTGLGLAISKEIILAHKGRIWAESEVGKGSSFHFILPLIKEGILV